MRGEIVVGELVYLAVERHYRDLRDGAKRGLRFDVGRAWHIIRYIEKYFVHIKGSLAGKPILLDPWQKFWTAVKYGWLREDGYRRFTRGYEEVARKNGKSTWTGPQGDLLCVRGTLKTNQEAEAWLSPCARSIWRAVLKALWLRWTGPRI